jgi:hypothetical protein
VYFRNEEQGKKFRGKRRHIGSERPIKTLCLRDGRMAQVVEHLPSKHEALSFEVLRDILKLML